MLKVLVFNRLRPKHSLTNHPVHFYYSRLLSQIFTKWKQIRQTTQKTKSYILLLKNSTIKDLHESSNPPAFVKQSPNYIALKISQKTFNFIHSSSSIQLSKTPRKLSSPCPMEYPYSQPLRLTKKKKNPEWMPELWIILDTIGRHISVILLNSFKNYKTTF